MWFFSSKKLSEKEKVIINQIEVLISKIEEKRKQWKEYEVNFVILDPSAIGAFDWPPRPTYAEIELSELQQRYMMKMKRACISICSKFISCLILAVGYIKKEEEILLKSKLNKVLNSLEKELASAFSSRWVGKLAELHEIAYKSSWRYKKYYEEKYLRDLDYYKEGLEEARKMNNQKNMKYYSEQIDRLKNKPKEIEVIFHRMKKNFREGKFRRGLKEVRNFKKYLGQTINEYKSLINNINLTI